MDGDEGDGAVNEIDSDEFDIHAELEKVRLFTEAVVRAMTIEDQLAREIIRSQAQEAIDSLKRMYDPAVFSELISSPRALNVMPDVLIVPREMAQSLQEPLSRQRWKQEDYERSRKDVAQKRRDQRNRK
jgi:hypothetical protein